MLKFVPILWKNWVKKREVPFKRGRLTIWASAVIHIVAQLNFLFDKESTHHISFDNIVGYFNTKKSTIGSKSRNIQSILEIDSFSFEFTEKHTLEEILLSTAIVSDEGYAIPISKIEKTLQKELIKDIIEKNGEGYRILDYLK